jgi:hypothetical protein
LEFAGRFCPVPAPWPLKDGHCLGIYERPLVLMSLLRLPAKAGGLKRAVAPHPSGSSATIHPVCPLQARRPGDVREPPPKLEAPRATRYAPHQHWPVRWTKTWWLVVF